MCGTVPVMRKRSRSLLIGRQGVKPGTRERILTRYPYKVVYEIRDDVIEIDRVLHAARQR